MVKKWDSLADKVWHPSNLAKAAAAVLANHGAAGLDHQSCVQFGEHLADELATLGLALREHRYRPQPVRRVYIPKPGEPDQRRPLGIPAVRDRVVQQAVRQVLEPIWEPTFSDTSYGFRPGRSALGGLDWPHVGQVFRVERHVTDLLGNHPRDEVAWGITDLGPDAVDASHLNPFVRGHWGIETRLHYVRDWTYDEDRSQVRTQQGPQVMATLRNTAIGLLRHLKLPNISRAVKHLDRHPEQIAALVLG